MTDAGDVLGEWELVERIGRGGMGEVWRARHLTRSTDAAVKVLFVRPDRRREARERFAREVEAARHLDHPGVCAVEAWGEDPDSGALYMVMELLRGVSFRRWLDDTRGSPLEAIELLRDVLDPLAAAHRFRVDGAASPIVHRDLKPENLFVLDEAMAPERIKLLDFGIARRADAEQITETGVGMGTAGYMSPEQATDARVVGPASDVWSVGVMLYEVVAGRAPFSSPSRNETISKILTRDPVPLEDRVPGVPAALGELIRACLLKDPARRPADAVALAAALDAILADERSRAALEDLEATDEREAPDAPVGATTRAPRAEARPSRAVPVALIGLGVAGAVAVAIALGRADPTPRPSPPRELPVASSHELDAEDAGAPSTNRWIRVEGDPIRLGVSDDATAEGVSGFRPAAEVMGEGRPFEIMQHEVTFAELEDWLVDELAITRLRRPLWLPEERHGRARFPATGVPWDVARRYCVEQDGDLPTEAQWEQAARGSARRAYAWGDAAPVAGRVNLGDDAHPGPVMTFEQDRTPGPSSHAIYDLTGNAREWTRDLFRNNDGSPAEWADAEERTFRVVRGLPLAIRSVWEPPREAPIAHRVPLCATGPCPEGTYDVSVDVGFRCARPAP